MACALLVVKYHAGTVSAAQFNGMLNYLTKHGTGRTKAKNNVSCKIQTKPVQKDETLELIHSFPYLSRLGRVRHYLGLDESDISNNGQMAYQMSSKDKAAFAISP